MLMSNEHKRYKRNNAVMRHKIRYSDWVQSSMLHYWYHIWFIYSDYPVPSAFVTLELQMWPVFPPDVKSKNITSDWINLGKSYMYLHKSSKLKYSFGLSQEQQTCYMLHLLLKRTPFPIFPQNILQMHHKNFGVYSAKQN